MKYLANIFAKFSPSENNRPVLDELKLNKQEAVYLNILGAMMLIFHSRPHDLKCESVR